MCGIIAVIHPTDAVSPTIDGLRTLEYRGYDSTGIASFGTHDFVLKSIVSVEDLARQASEVEKGTRCIGHTRWATRGEVTLANAHPHCVGRITLVHNGVVENLSDLIAHFPGVQALPQGATDTYLLAQILDHLVCGGQDLVQAICALSRGLEGMHALVAVDSESDEEIVALSHGLPLVAGRGPSCVMIASDHIAFSSEIADITRLPANTGIVASSAGIRVFRPDAASCELAWETAAKREEAAEKHGFAHWMRAEIEEIPRTIAQTRNALQEQAAAWSVQPATKSTTDNTSSGARRRILFLGCGSSYYAATVAVSWLRKDSTLDAIARRSGELLDEPEFTDQNTLVVAISQSGETADTLAAIRSLRKNANGGPRVLAICNVAGSTLCREADFVALTHAGREQSVAATKSVAAQLTALAHLAQSLAPDCVQGNTSQMVQAASDAIACESRLAHATKLLLAARGCLVIARDELLGVAYELALKLQELSYLPAIACHAGELKHGPLALIDHDLPTVVLIADNENGEKTMVAVQEILARRGPILVLAQLARPVEFVESETAHWLQLPTRSRGTSETAISFLTASHLLAYHAALHAGRPIDRPRHLAKSVTVV